MFFGAEINDENATGVVGDEKLFLVLRKIEPLCRDERLAAHKHLKLIFPAINHVEGRAEAVGRKDIAARVYDQITEQMLFRLAGERIFFQQLACRQVELENG